jgi:hypothetical protein
MTFQQAYYTSCTSGLRESMGFQFNAVSRGVDARMFEQLERIGLYSPPRQAPIQPTPEELAQFPVMLSYQLLDGGQMVIAQSKYVGLDYSGRWGNYFAHFLLASATKDDLGFLPIELWQSPLWTTRESSDRELPMLENPEVSGSITPADVRQFLERHPEHVAPMVEATRTALTTGRRVVIIDDAQSVALWIAAVTYALPRHLAMATSFTTYAKSPYESGATIIGTTPDSDFRGTDFEIDHQYSVFDFARGRFSRIEAASRYARGVAAAYKESADRVAEFPAFAARVDPEVDAANLDSTWFGYSLASGSTLSDAVSAEDIRWFAPRLARFAGAQLRQFLDAAVAAAATPGVVDALFELYEHSRRVASAAQIVEECAFSLLVRASNREPEQYAARIISNAPYGSTAIQLAEKLSSEWLFAIESSSSSARVASLLSAGEFLGFGRIDPQRLGTALVRWIDDAAVQTATLRIAAAGAGEDVLRAILNPLRETRARVFEPLTPWLLDERVRNATRDVFVATGDVNFYTRVLCARDRDRVRAFGVAISGAQQIDGKLTAARADEVFNIVWGHAPMTAQEAIRVCDSCASVLPSTSLLQRLPPLLLAADSDPVAVARLAEILGSDELKRPLGERRRFVDVYRLLRELATPRHEPQKAIQAAIALLSRDELPPEAKAQLNYAAASSLAALRDVSQHAKLMLSARNSPDFVNTYERYAIAHLHAEPHVAIPAAAFFFDVWNARHELGSLDRVLLTELRAWSKKRRGEISYAIERDHPRALAAWRTWIEQNRKVGVVKRISRLFGGGKP